LRIRDECSRAAPCRKAASEEAPRARIQVDQDLDRPQQLGRELDLVDDHEPVVLDEPRRVVPRGLQCGSVIEEAHDRAGPAIGRQSRRPVGI
jgi:hypothetical protein